MKYFEFLNWYKTKSSPPQNIKMTANGKGTEGGGVNIVKTVKKVLPLTPCISRC